MSGEIPEGASCYEGRCHCGGIAYSYYTRSAPDKWSVRACQCSFCRAHGALSTSDPSGFVIFHARAGAPQIRYRFGQRTADFLICGDCGVYVAAVIDTDRGAFTVVNINALNPRIEHLPAPQPMSYDTETPEQRIHRRMQRWTPCKRI